MQPETISRIIFWTLFAIALGIFTNRAVFLYRLMRLGQPDSRSDSLGKRLGVMLWNIFPQRCSLKSLRTGDFAGLGHAFIFWGFILFFLNYVIFMFVGDGFGMSEALRGNIVSRVFFYALDIAGAIVALSLIWAIVRRYVFRPMRLVPSGEAAFILVIIFLLMLFHFLIEGFGIGSGDDALAKWMPVGAAFGSWFSGMGLSEAFQESAAAVMWWAHYLILIGFFVYLLYSKHLHIIASFPNIFLSSLKPRGALKLLDLETAESYGVSGIEGFSWKQLLDLYACTQCGRCHANCPAQLTGKELSPRKLILDLKEHLLHDGPARLTGKKNGEDGEGTEKSLLGDIITDEVLWECTTCRACQEQCPTLIEHVDKVVDMRRSLVMELARMPDTTQKVLVWLEKRGNTCIGTTATRTDWTDGLDIKVLSDSKDMDILYWVGCAAALESRNMKVAIAVGKTLKAAGVNFGILGVEETCCGDPARRMGNEYLYQLQAMKNIETMKGYGVKQIVTSCPHCYNALKNEYPQMGGDFEVIHHSQLLGQLVEEGKLKPVTGVDGLVTYHDSCYLGRYNDLYQDPRRVLSAIPGLELKDMDRSFRYSFCCGAGGGRYWMEERTGKRISEERIEEVIATSAGTVASACPYCLAMFEDAIKDKGMEEKLFARDIAELMAQSIEGGEQTSSLSL